MKITIRVVVLLAIVVAIGICVHYLGKGDLTARENGLLSIVLTGLSVLASWAVTEMYSASQYKEALEEVQEQHRSNLRTYALKAAEKVNNLSSELSRLAVYLQQELDYTEYRNAEEELTAKEERLESAIHLINTLKSVNDTALSDWQGVIGDELEEQREEKSEREERLMATLAEMEHFLIPEVSALKEHRISAEDVQRQLELMRREIRLAVSTASGGSVPLPKIGRKRTIAEAKCPACGELTTFRGASAIGLTKAAKCRICHSKLMANLDDERGPYLTVRVPVEEKIVCPACEADNKILIDPAAGSSSVVSCQKCSCRISATRTKAGLQIRGLGSLPKTEVAVAQAAIPEGLLNLIRDSLPAQPWPTGTARQVATALGIKHSVVSAAIQVLIKRGDFRPQVDGVLYAPVE